ncbi:hypothetical protein DFH07DRAFT_67876 [Mycena maculata]|uniref:F-box domain-containing protein n=1 Tax=Mycena maculata TaxID=230809 RepID=A0AAD7N0M7_9AGAR|nr:hypothetical protein DFH07DRAFT_67876 [Mycena maculata]
MATRCFFTMRKRQENATCLPRVIPFSGPAQHPRQHHHAKKMRVMIEFNTSPSCSQTTMFLPQELLETILEQVNDGASLKRCALASKSLLVPSQRSLFRSLYLYTTANISHQPSGTCEHACALFTSSPHLANYVRTLTLCMERVEGHTAFERVLQMLHLINRLGLHGSSDSFRWDDMSPTLVSSILHAVQRPALQCFHLKRIIGVPTSLMFYAATAFRVFSLERVEILDSDAASFLVPNIPPTARLEQLVIPAAFRSDTVCAFLLRLNTEHSLIYLRRLVWRIYRSPSQHWERLLQEATFLRTLAHLELWFTLGTSSTRPH